MALGEVPTIPYQMPTTWQFANDVGAAMRQAEAALLENHGSVAVGATLQAAFNKMEIVERAAQILYLAKLLGRVNRCRRRRSPPCRRCDRVSQCIRRHPGACAVCLDGVG